jgi:hypothetical protein
MANTDYDRDRDWDRDRYGRDINGNQYDRGGWEGREAGPYDRDRSRREYRGDPRSQYAGYGGTAYGQEGWQGRRDDDMYSRQPRHIGANYGEGNWQGGTGNTGYPAFRSGDYGGGQGYGGRSYDQARYGMPYGGAQPQYTGSAPGTREPWRVPGPFTGKGPRGYTRSDERIREDVNDRLTQHGQIDASDIEVGVSGGVVTLNGSVENRDQKRMAEDAIEDIPGVQGVHNQLRVRQGLIAQIKDALTPGDQGTQQDVTTQ